ncbi:MAG: hypothetical protein Q8K36_02150, partial [Alphaproteobacteria bacterium]|nr:hypothetical protein [Alphaproteobacteria bacterium]
SPESEWRYVNAIIDGLSHIKREIKNNQSAAFFTLLGSDSDRLRKNDALCIENQLYMLDRSPCQGINLRITAMPRIVTYFNTTSINRVRPDTLDRTQILDMQVKYSENVGESMSLTTVHMLRLARGFSSHDNPASNMSLHEMNGLQPNDDTEKWYQIFDSLYPSSVALSERLEAEKNLHSTNPQKIID